MASLSIPSTATEESSVRTTPRHGRATLPCLLFLAIFATASAGCTSDSEPDRVIDDPNPEPEPEPDPEPEPGPSWEGLTIRKDRQWRSFGEVSRLVSGPFGADGSRLTLVAGRELLAVSGEGKPLWRSLWGGSVHGSLAVSMAVVENEAAGPARVLITNDAGEAQLFEPATGKSIWQTTLDVVVPEPVVTVFGDPADPLFVPDFGRHAYRVSTGAKRWKVPMPEVPVWMAAARQGPGEPTILFAALPRERGTNVTLPDTFAISSTGEVLFRFASPSFVTALAAVDLDGDGYDSLLVGTPEGRLFALDDKGETRWERGWDLGPEALPTTTYIERLIRWDRAGEDGKDAILLTLRDYNRPDLTRLIALDADGEELWSMDLGNMASQLRLGATDDGEVLFLSLGVRMPMVPNAILAVDLRPSTEERVMWRFEAAYGVSDLDFVSETEGAGLLVGTPGGQLLTLDPRTGETLEEDFLGYFGSAAFDFADGHVVSGDFVGSISLFDAEGKRLWHRPMSPSGPGLVGDARFFPWGEELRIAAFGQTFAESHLPGSLKIFSMEGGLILERTLEAPPIALEVADLQGEGRVELLLGLLHPAGCRVAAIDPEEGEIRWSAELPRCHTMSIAAGDTDGDDLPELAVTGFSQGHGSFVALLGGDGEVRWLHSIRDVPMWAKPTKDAVIVAGAARESNGMVERRSADDGAIEWSTIMHGRPRVDDPRETRKGYVAHASLLPPRQTDRSGDIVVTTEEGSVALLDGTDGAIRWTVAYEEDDPKKPPVRFGGPVAFVPAAEEIPGWILASQRTWSPVRTGVVAISLEGEVLGRFEIEGTTGRILPAKSATGAPAAIVSSQLGFTSFAVHEEEAEAP